MTRRSQPPYPPELREGAVRMVAEIREDYDSAWAAMNAVAERLGVPRRPLSGPDPASRRLDRSTREGDTHESPCQLSATERPRVTA